MNKTKNRKMDLFSRLWIKVIQFRNTGKWEGDFFETHLFEKNNFRDPHIPKNGILLRNHDFEKKIS